MFVKLCGITRLKDMRLACSLGASAVGFIFYKKSKRCISPGLAAQLSPCKGTVKTVGVFVDAGPSEIIETVEIAGLDMVQIYDRSLLAQLSGRCTVLLAHRISNAKDIRMIEPPDGNNLLLLDSSHATEFGGTGTRFDWRLLEECGCLDRTIVAGGINAQSLPELFAVCRPYGIDVSSGIETSPGIKCEDTMRTLMKTIKEIINENRHA